MTQGCQPYVRRAAQLMDRYIDQLSPYDFSPISYGSNVRAVVEIEHDLRDILVSSFMDLTLSMEHVVSSLKDRCERILSGVRKKILTEMWHVAVNEGINSLLCDMGYSFEAAPYDYINEPPSSMSAISHNLSILQQLLSNSDQCNRVAHLAHKLRRKVYPACESFVEEALLVAQHVLSCDPPSVDKDAVVQLKQQVELLSKSGVEFDLRVKDVLDDVVYLREMRRLEDSPEERHPHIVPVTGLTISSLVRKEKEMTTIVEVWKSKV